MGITEEQYERIKERLPRQRGDVSLSNLEVLNAILPVAEEGGKWRGLPRRFGRWHTIYTRMNRWSKGGVLERVFERMQREQIIRIKLEAVSLDGTIIKVHPPTGQGRGKNGPQAIAKSRGGWSTRIHLVAANACCALSFALSPARAGDAPGGRNLLRAWKSAPRGCHLIMDRACEGDETRQPALDLGFTPVVPPKSNRPAPWQYDKEMYPAGTKSNASSAASKASVASSLVSRNST